MCKVPNGSQFIMMETFLVLGLCFILYEALDFFQGCIHSATPSASDQIDAYRRQLDEQRQKHQEEQFLANLTPLLSAQLAAAGFNLSTTTTPTASTASIISDLKVQVQTESENYSVSTPALNGQCDRKESENAFRPANRSVYATQQLHNTSSLPRDYYYLQQQQLKNKNSSKSLLSKFSTSGSDNRIFPEAHSRLGNPAGVITTQPLSQHQQNSYDSPIANITETPATLKFADELNRSLLKQQNHNCNSNSNTNNNNDDTKTLTRKHSQITLSSQGIASEEEEEGGESEASSTQEEASLDSCPYDSDHDINEDRTFTVGSCSSSHADFREIECERLRRQCVSVKRIYSISEKF